MSQDPPASTTRLKYSMSKEKSAEDLIIKNSIKLEQRDLKYVSPCRIFKLCNSVSRRSIWNIETRFSYLAVEINLEIF